MTQKKDDAADDEGYDKDDDETEEKEGKGVQEDESNAEADNLENGKHLSS